MGEVPRSIPPVTPPIILVTVSTGLVEPILPVTVPTASETRPVVVVVRVFVTVDRVSESKPEVDIWPSIEELPVTVVFTDTILPKS